MNPEGFTYYENAAIAESDVPWTLYSGSLEGYQVGSTAVGGASVRTQRRVIRLWPPMVQVKRVRSQSPFSISSVAEGRRISNSDTV